jgi:hypothetical protein
MIVSEASLARAQLTPAMLGVSGRPADRLPSAIHLTAHAAGIPTRHLFHR